MPTTPPMIEVEIPTPAAKRARAAAPAGRRYAGEDRVRVALFASDGTGDLVPLVGESGYRLRVGDWRVIFEVEGSTMIILRVKPRGEAYS